MRFFNIVLLIFVSTITTAQAECIIKHCPPDGEPHYPSTTTQIQAKKLDELHTTITHYLNNKYNIQLSTELHNLISNMLIVCTEKSYSTQYIAEVACSDAMSPIDYELRLIAEEILN
jgi:hypothetical protein